MAGELVLITGGSGLLGIKAIHLALQYGYHVRAAVRSQAKAEAILATPTIRALGLTPSSPELSFVTVPDMLAEGAYDQAVHGVSYILHIASPTLVGEGWQPEQFESHLIGPAVQGTMGILKAAAKENQNRPHGIKRIVITSSEVAIIPWEEFIAKEVDTVFDDSYQLSELPMPPYANQFEAYAAGKVRALHAALDFIQTQGQEKLGFDVIHIMPGFLIGTNEIITEADKLCDGTVAAALAPVLGKDSGWGAVPSTSVLVADVAELHLRALDPKISGNQAFLASSETENGGTKWEQFKEIVAKHFPQAVAKGVLPNNGPAATKKIKIDVSRTEKVFGIKFKSFEEQVRSVVEQYLRLKGEEVA